MSRVKRGVTSHARHRKVLKQAKGYYGRRKNTIRVAKQAVEKAGQYAYRDRKVRKRTWPRSSGAASGMRVAPSVNPTRLRTAVLSTASPSRERCTSESNKCSNQTYVRSFSPGSQAGYPVRSRALEPRG